MIMDPNVTLQEIKTLMALAIVGTDAQQAKDDLVYKVDDLLQWLAKGGYPPDWTQ